MTPVQRSIMKSSAAIGLASNFSTTSAATTESMDPVSEESTITSVIVNSSAVIGLASDFSSHGLRSETKKRMRLSPVSSSVVCTSCSYENPAGSCSTDCPAAKIFLDAKIFFDTLGEERREEYIYSSLFYSNSEEEKPVERY